MKKQKTLCILLSIILIFLFSSCELIMSFFSPEEDVKDKEIGEFEDVNIFDAELLPDEISFITEYSIAADEDYFYCVTTGYKEVPGKIVKVRKDGDSPLIKTLYTEAIQSGYIDSHAFYLESVSCYNEQLLVKALPAFIQFEHGEFELFCLKSEDLSVQWRWTPDENGRIDYNVTGNPTIPKWKDYFIIYYAEEKNDDGYYLIFLDTNGNQVIKRFIPSSISLPIEDHDLCIVEDKLLLHQKYEPLAIYDLNKLIAPNYDSKDCIDYEFPNEEKIYEANIYSNIVSDGKTCYFCCWKTINREECKSNLIVYGVSLENYHTLWTYEIDDKNFDGVNGIFLHKENLFLAADYGCVYCLDTKNGRLNWKTKLTDENHSINLFCEGCIVKNYFVIPSCSNSFLYYIDIDTGIIKGKYYIPIFGGERHCYAEGDYLYITTGSYIARLRLKET
ncbi:MAG: PQQ-like beta-propeller repeat protein [Treponema sp.]|nr:PQQ-like beta-propeller repeat protein [Treponema sp.]